MPFFSPLNVLQLQLLHACLSFLAYDPCASLYANDIILLICIRSCGGVSSSPSTRRGSIEGEGVEAAVTHLLDQQRPDSSSKLSSGVPVLPSNPPRTQARRSTQGSSGSSRRSSGGGFPPVEIFCPAGPVAVLGGNGCGGGEDRPCNEPTLSLAGPWGQQGGQEGPASSSSRALQGMDGDASSLATTDPGSPQLMKLLTQIHDVLAAGGVAFVVGSTTASRSPSRKASASGRRTPGGMRSLAPSAGGAKVPEPSSTSNSAAVAVADASPSSSKVNTREAPPAAGCTHSARDSSRGCCTAGEGGEGGACATADSTTMEMGKHQSAAAKAEQLRKRLEMEIGEDNLVAAYR